MEQLGVDFRDIEADVPEIWGDYFSPYELCQINAYRKARAVAKKHPDDLVLGADTIVCLGHQILGKPRNLEDAFNVLRRLQGKSHEVATGVCLLHLRGHRQSVFAESTTVTFRSLRPEDIRRYLAKIDPLDKAGAYAIQEHGELIVREVSGSFSNVVGLPLERVQAELEKWK